MADGDVQPGADGAAAEEEILARSLFLVQRAKQGDRPALEELFARYEDRIRRIVSLRLTGEARRLLDTMDVVQETLAVALRRIEDFEPRGHGSIIGWFVTIAERKIKDERVRPKPERLPADSEGDSLGAREPAGRELSPSQVAGARELKEIYDDCVRELPDAQREIVLWRDYGLFTWSEICEQVGSPSAHAAEQLYQRASKALSESLRRRISSL